MTSNTPASVPLQIVQASKLSPTDDGDLHRLMRLSTEVRRSDPLTWCMLRQPYTEWSHQQYAHFHYLPALQDNNSRVFIALDLARSSPGAVLGSLWIMHCRITAPPPNIQLPDYINEEAYRYTQSGMNVQRRTELRRDFYYVAALDVPPAHPHRHHIRKTLASFAVAELRKVDRQTEIVAQATVDEGAFDQVFPASEGWEHVQGALVLDSVILPWTNVEQRSVRLFVNWGVEAAR